MMTYEAPGDSQRQMTYEAPGRFQRLNIDAPNGGDDPNYECNLELYKAATRGDWATAAIIFHDHPRMLTAEIDHREKTVLHVAVSSSRNMLFVRNLVRLMVQQGRPLGPRSSTGSTPLHCAAQAGNTEIARLLVEADRSLLTLLDTKNDSPLHMAAYYQHKEATEYLLEKTLWRNPNSLVGASGLKILISLISDGFYDLAVWVLQENPRLSVERVVTPGGTETRTALLALAEQPQAFQSGILLTFCPHLLDHGLSISYTSLCYLLRAFGKRLPPFQLFNKVRDEKQRRKNVVKILKSLVDNASKSEQASDILGPASRKAAECGNLKFVKVVIKAYPQIVTLVDYERRNIFDIAVINRQENIFNLIFQLGSWKYFTMGFDAHGCTMLHHAAAFHPTTKINRIPGAALQMQRELQWYTAVENIVQPSCKLQPNDEGKTPERVFTESHRELVKEGGQWMKNTAKSYTVVAALVVTITFAAAFTAPGGIHDNTGKPVFLNDPSFMIFAIADALALFSSTTSLLMFLGILTSRYSQEDFLKTIPMKLATSLITLFFSVGLMLAAFTASVHVMLSKKVIWIVVPIGLVACLPLLLFAFLQFPLLIELVYSSFGPTIFRKQSAKMLL